MKSKWLVIALALIPSIAFAGPTEDLAGIMQTFQTQLGPIYTLMVAFSYVLGVWFVADAVFKLKKFGQQRTMMSSSASMGKPIFLLLLGVAMIYFPTLVNITTATFWVYGKSKSIIKYPDEPSAWNAFVYPLIDTVRLFGLIAVVRGVIMLSKLANESSQPGSLGKGLTHIIAGTLLINITGTINVFRATFGL